MRWAHEEIQVADVRLYRHLVHQTALRKDHQTLGQVHADVDGVSGVELPALHRIALTTLGWEL